MMRKLKLPRAFAPALATLLVVAGCGGSAPLTPHQKSVHRAAVIGGLATPTQTTYGGRTHSQAFLQSVLSPPPAALPSQPTATPQLSGYDAVTASAVPFKAQVALCYTNGHYANCAAVKARQPQHLVTIAVNTSGVARLLDVEPHDATPSQAGPWVRSMIRRHIWRPGIYANASTMPAVEQSLRSAGLSRSQYVLMVAAWDGNPTVPGGFDAKQWRSTQSLDFDSFLTSFFHPSTPRTICWGKHSTPASPTCRKIEARAGAALAGYKRTEHNLGMRRTELKNVSAKIVLLQADKIHVKATAYIGPGQGWARAQIKTLTARATHEKATHDKLVKQYS